MIKYLAILTLLLFSLAAQATEPDKSKESCEIKAVMGKSVQIIRQTYNDTWKEFSKNVNKYHEDKEVQLVLIKIADIVYHYFPEKMPPNQVHSRLLSGCLSYEESKRKEYEI